MTQEQKHLFKQWLTTNMRISEVTADLIVNHVSHYFHQPPAAQSDQEAAEKYADRFYKVLPYDQYESDYDYRIQVAKNKQLQEHYLAGCTRVRGQQQVDAVAKEAAQIIEELHEILMPLHLTPYNLGDNGRVVTYIKRLYALFTARHLTPKPGSHD